VSTEAGEVHRTTPSALTQTSTIDAPDEQGTHQISPGARGTIGPTPTIRLHNHSPPHLTEAPVQISRHSGLATRGEVESVLQRSPGVLGR
jgi:hypothetical protein